VTGAQNAAAGTGNAVFQDPELKAATRTNWKSQVLQVITILCPGKPSCTLIKTSSGAVVGTGNAVFQDLDQNNIQKQFGF